MSSDGANVILKPISFNPAPESLPSSLAARGPMAATASGEGKGGKKLGNGLTVPTSPTSAKKGGVSSVCAILAVSAAAESGDVKFAWFRIIPAGRIVRSRFSSAELQQSSSKP